MRLPGRLSSTTLGDVLATLYRGGISGTLQLVECSGATAGRCHRVYLQAGLVHHVETPIRVARLGEILRQQGFLNESAVHRLARRLVEEPGMCAGQLLVADSLATPDEVAAALRHQLILQLEAIYGLREAMLRFHVSGSKVHDARVRVPLSPREFLYGRPRARGSQRRRVAQRAQAGSARGRPSEVADPHARRRALSVLGLHAGADRETVQRAFRRLAGRLHPDRHPHASGEQRATLMRSFVEVSRAYHELVG